MGIGVNISGAVLAKAIAGLAAISLVPQIAAAKDAQPLVVEPSSQWNVDYGKETCRLARIFGEGENRHAIFFEQWGPDVGFSFTAAGPGFDRFKGDKDTQWRVFDGHEPRDTQPMKGDLGSVGPALIYASLNLEKGHDYFDSKKDEKLAEEERAPEPLPALDIEFANKATFIAVKQGKHEVILNTGSLGEPFKVLNDCALGLITEWGLDLEKHKTRSRAPVWTNEAAVTRRIISVYPTIALNKGEQGIMQIRVNIDEKGAVTECTIGKATNTQYLNSPACRPMKKAKFEPALDKDGKPMASYYRTNIIYRLNS